MAAEAERQVNFLFPTVIRTVILPDAAAINARLMPAITDLRARVPGDVPDSWSCTLYTTFNTAHDLKLPGSKEPAIPFLMYPQAENRDGFLDSLDPDAFRYKITARELTA